MSDSDETKDVLGLGGSTVDATSTSNGSNTNKISVAIRCRPQIDREREAKTEEFWIVKENEIVPKSIEVDSCVGYKYDHIFNQTASTKDVYEGVVSPIVKKAVNGFNGTVLCYGQTSSGKTHTLYGSERINDKGIITLFAEQLFNQIQSDADKDYIVKVAVIEIYMEKLTDLLNSSNSIELKEKEGKVFPVNLEEIEVSSGRELIEIAETAQSSRRTGSTLMNERSSRSHTALRVSIQIADLKQVILDKPVCTTSVLHFVDLAGSEKQKQTGAEGERLVEAININQSLSTLSKVINQLAAQAEKYDKAVAKAVTDPRKPVASRMGLLGHVSFRDSKLTRLLQSTLQGEAFIALICTVTIASAAETKSTLQFATRAKNVKLQPKQNLCTTNEFQRKVLELEQLLQMRDKENAHLTKKLETWQKWMGTPTTTPKKEVKEVRRYSLCDPFRSRQLQPQPITHRYSHTSAIDDDFMDTVGALKRFEMDRRDRSTIWEQEECPRSQHKEVQTDEMPANSQVTHMKQQKPVGTPIASLRMTNTLLRVAGEADNSEQQEKIQFLEAEIKGLRAVENQLSECLKEKEVYKKEIELLQLNVRELENDVLRQMESSKKNRMMVDSEAISKNLADLQENYEKLQTELSEQKLLLEAKEKENVHIALEFAQYTSNHEEMKSELSTCKEEINLKDSKIDELHTTYKSELSDLKELLEALEEKNSKCVTELTLRTRQYEEVKNDLTEAVDALNNLTSSTQPLQDQLNKWKDIVATKDATIQELELKLRTELSEQRALLEAKEEEKMRFVSELKQYSTEYEESKKGWASTVEELNDLKVSLQTLQEELTKCKGTLASKDAKIGELDQKLNHQKALLELNETEKTKAITDLEHCNREYNELKMGLDSTEKELLEIKATLQSTQNELTNCMNLLESKDSSIQELEAQLKREVSDLKAKEVLLAEKEDQLAKLVATHGEGLSAKTNELNDLKASFKALQDDLANYKRTVESKTVEIEELTKTRQNELSFCKEEITLRDSKIGELHTTYKSELSDLKELLEALEEKNSKCVTELTLRTRQYDEVKNDLTEAVDALNNLTSSTQPLQDQLNKWKDIVATKDATIQELDLKLQTELSEQRTLLEAKEEENMRLVSELKQYTTEYEESKKGWASTVEELNDLKVSLQTLQEELTKCKGTLASKDAKIEELENDVLRQMESSKKNRMMVDSEAISKNLADLQENYEKLQTELSEQKLLLEAKEKENVHIALEFAQYTSNHEEMKSELSSCKEEITLKDSKIGELHTTYKTELSDLKELLEALEEKNSKCVTELTLRTKQYEEVKNDLTEVKDIVATKDATIQELDLKLRTELTELSEQRTLLEAKEEENIRLVSELKQYTKEYEESKKGWASTVDELNYLKVSLQTLQEELTKCKETLASKDAKIRELEQTRQNVLHEKQRQIAELEVKLSELVSIEADLKVYKKSTTITTNRGTQATDEHDELENKCKHYREVALCRDLKVKQLEKQLKVLETRENKTAEYQKLLDEKDREIASFVSHIKAIPVQEKEITIETGIQCVLLEEQLTRAHCGEKVVLPKFIPDIHQMRSRHEKEVKWLQDSLQAEKKKNAAKSHADGSLGGTSKYISSRYTAVGQSAPKYPTLYSRNFKPSNVDNTGAPSTKSVSTNSLVIEHQHSSKPNIPQVLQSNAKTSEEPCKKRKAEKEMIVQDVKKPLEQNTAFTVSDAKQLNTSSDAFLDDILGIREDNKLTDRDHLDNLQNIPQVPQSNAKTSEEPCKKRKAEKEMIVQDVKKPLEQNTAFTVSGAKQLNISSDAFLDDILGIREDNKLSDLDHLDNLQNIPQVPQSNAETSVEPSKKCEAEKKIILQDVRKPLLEQNTAFTVSDAKQLNTSSDAFIDEFFGNV